MPSSRDSLCRHKMFPNLIGNREQRQYFLPINHKGAGDGVMEGVCERERERGLVEDVAKELQHANDFVLYLVYQNSLTNSSRIRS